MNTMPSVIFMKNSSINTKISQISFGPIEKYLVMANWNTAIFSYIILMMHITSFILIQIHLL